MAFPNKLRSALSRLVSDQKIRRAQAQSLFEAQRTIKRLEKRHLETSRQIKGLEAVARHLMLRYRGIYMLAPPELCLHVGTVRHAANYWKQGLDSSERVIEVFGENPGGPVLDWGCGVGRTLHWLQDRDSWGADYRGCDVDPEAIAWLRGQGFANVELSGDMPPLPYADDYFVGLFCFSVLTHIPPMLHAPWFKEIHRVLRPGGRAYLTVHGDAHMELTKSFTPEEQRHYRAKGWLFSEREGHHKHAALVRESFTRPVLEELFEVERYASGAYHAMDEIIVRKKG